VLFCFKQVIYSELIKSYFLLL